MLSKVHRIELHNFKSYAGDVTIGPFKDFTCIVGPNGAGKSNLMDALSFVLSTTDVISMRGRNITDMINRKAARSEDCAVTIVLRHPPSRSTKAVASAGNESGLVETSFTRRVDHKGAVSMQVNRKTVSEKQFYSLLETHRIGKRVNTFLVFQHEVEAVAQKKAKELTELLEQVSGSGELKQDYNAKKATLTAANEALTTASVEKRGATVAVQQIRLAKKEADKYEEVSRRYAQEKRDVALVELFHVETELENQKQELQRFNDNLAKLEKSVTSEQAARDMKHKYAELHKAYLEDLKKHRKAGDDLRTKRNTMDRITAALAHLTRKYEAQRGELESLKKTETVRSAELKRLETQRDKQVALLAAFDQQVETEKAEHAKASASLTGEHLSEYRQLRKEADCETVMLRQQQETVKRQRDFAEKTQKQCAMATEHQKQQRAELGQSIDRAATYEKELEQRLKDLRESCTTLEKHIAESRKNLSQLQHKNSEREAELARIMEHMHEFRSIRDADKHNSRIADAQQALRSLFPIRGRLVDLCTIPNDKYRNAVTVAMGRHLEALIVDTTDVAIACVRYLKEQRMPPMTFLPLDAVQGKAADDRLRTFGGTCKLVVDVLRYEPFLEPAVRFAVGQTLVCDTIAEAKQVAYGRPDGERFKVVTVDGNLLLKNGSLQGGLAAVQSRARKWDEKKYEDLRAARDRLLSETASGGEAELARATIAIRDMETRLEFAQGRIKVVEKELLSNQGRLQSLKGELAAQDKVEKDIAQRERRCKQDLEATEKELLTLSRAISQIEAKTFAEFQKKVNIPNLLQLERQQEQAARQRGEQRQQHQLLLHKLESAIEMEVKRVGGDPLVVAEEAAARLEKEMSQCKKDLQTYKSVVDKSHAAYEELKKSVSAARTGLDGLEQSIRQSARTSETELGRLAHIRKGATGLHAACDALRLRRLDLVVRCQMEEADLPLVPAPSPGTKHGRDAETLTAGSDGQLLRSEPFTLQSNETQEPSSSLSSSTPAARKRGGAAAAVSGLVCVDFSTLTDSQRHTGSDRVRCAAYKQRTESLTEALLAEMEKLAPNMKAASKFVSTEDKLGETSTALEEAKDRARKAHAEFLQVKELRTQRFMDTYEKIASNVDTVYQELTLGTRAHAVHGSAYLSLEDVEEPYLGGTTYHATPPMKRFMPMELLSGGERTMAALALLFAIHAVSPTPFFVLDEVDAALDAGNVEKLAHYLRKNASTCQFIVVSLKDQLYHMADLLVGVMKDKQRESSSVLTMDLRGYPY